MTNNIKIKIGDREIDLPFNLEEMFSQLQGKEMNRLFHNRPKELIPIPKIPRPQIQSQQVIRKIVHCKDIQVREVVIDMNKRLTKLEKLLEGKTLIKKGIDKQKIISKAKETPKTKGKSKEKPKDNKKSKGTKKKVGKKR